VPSPSSIDLRLCYLRAGYKRLINDPLQADCDEDYELSVARKKRAAEKDGTGYWWAPGAIAPDRAPDLANAGGR
jgi:hypothetical protein